ncbi:MAG: hypothetical protein A2951_02140 [Candidatus Buchananbacteria bacterium RIFCSPLOWO2_01_FULL_56_15]|uniref:Uncharacterized protein n=2 Tax=Candidatus Buchananiibacteriota TaxID=1817903 RepID=A0A1G1YE88_9BACT|nr:MAG: hypothetical protein A3J59_05110 [Candidatus Buchananbacteria bacterium RIFCSPHIGHO2_02_FULL_56_16]OGY55211.1 MAG: hypothetical protein A2951_02140 [Candidatus Buchananbacteria bacterium RIFCSPLOWO2_01_FULL_56_15]
MLITKEALVLFQRRCDRARREGTLPWEQEFRLGQKPAPEHGHGFCEFFPIDDRGRRLGSLGPSVYGRLTICG